MIPVAEVVRWFKGNGYELTAVETAGRIVVRYRHVHGTPADQDELAARVETVLANKPQIKAYLDLFHEWEQLLETWRGDKTPANQQGYTETFARLAHRLGLPYYDERGVNIFPDGWYQWAGLPVPEGLRV